MSYERMVNDLRAAADSYDYLWLDVHLTNPADLLRRAAEALEGQRQALMKEIDRGWDGYLDALARYERREITLREFLELDPTIKDVDEEMRRIGAETPPGKGDWFRFSCSCGYDPGRSVTEAEIRNLTTIHQLGKNHAYVVTQVSA